jgi:hypothetical protein
MSKKVFHVMYDDDAKLMDAARALVGKGIHVKDVFSPFPIHGLDPVIGVKRTRLAITSFMYATTGTLLAILGSWYFMIYDWPMKMLQPLFQLCLSFRFFVERMAWPLRTCFVMELFLACQQAIPIQGLLTTNL